MKEERSISRYVRYVHTLCTYVYVYVRVYIHTRRPRDSKSRSRRLIKPMPPSSLAYSLSCFFVPRSVISLARVSSASPLRPVCWLSALCPSLFPVLRHPLGRDVCMDAAARSCMSPSFVINYAWPIIHYVAASRQDAIELSTPTSRFRQQAYVPLIAWI